MPFDRETEVRSVSAAECFLRDYGTDGGSNRCSEKKKSTSVQLDESICGVGKKMPWKIGGMAGKAFGSMVIEQELSRKEIDGYQRFGLKESVERCV